MSVTLTLEAAPHPQRETSRSYAGGQMVIGRGDDCDWQIDDPEMYVSRKHCVITDESGEISVVDASTDGVFVDGGSSPLGAGNAITLEHEMRLRLGDYVIRVEMADAKPAANTAPAAKSPFDFGATTTPTPPVDRPTDLPPQFGVKKKDPFADDAPPQKAAPLDRDGPFDLDLKRDQSGDAPDRKSLGMGGYFDDKPDPTPEPSEPYPPIEIKRAPGNAGPAEPEPATIKARPATEPPVQPAAAAVSTQDVQIAALLRGMGLDAEKLNDFNEQDLEAIGARFRDMVDGLMFLLRTRAQERQKVRVAQTLIASRDVNPLKFLPTMDEAVLALIRQHGDSYLPGDKAVPGAFRDLADHQVRTWSALQTALRRMIDRFDPKEVEREMDDTGLLETLVAGGRSAKMWQLYQERYRDIAQAAEDRFLGEVGSDFRDAYETERK